MTPTLPWRPTYAATTAAVDLRWLAGAAAAGLLMTVLCAAACGPKKGTIGAVLGQNDDGELTIREVPEGLAADEAGLQPGDKILLIDGVDVRTLDAKGLRKALGGEVDDKVKLTVERGDEIIRVTLKRTPAKKLRAARAAKE
jgi:carboxyl-terminal processing protease